MTRVESGTVGPVSSSETSVLPSGLSKKGPPHGRTILVRGCDIFEFVGDKIRKKDAFRKVFDQIGGPV